MGWRLARESRDFGTQPIAAHQAIELTQVYSPVAAGGSFLPTSDPSSYSGSYGRADERPPRDLLMACVAGLRRTAPARYELTRENFQPTTEFRLMFLERTKPSGW